MFTDTTLGAPAIQESTQVARQKLTIAAIEAAYDKLSRYEQQAVDRECAALLRGIEQIAPNVRLGPHGARELLAKLGMWLVKNQPEAEVLP